MATADDYLGLITSEYADQPKYLATVKVRIQPYVDMQNLLERMPSLFDLDTAVGDQLDKTGEWIGLTRYLKVPLENVYFGWSDGITNFPGWGIGYWRGANTPTSDVTVALDDDHYRILLKARVVANHWDGTAPGAINAWQTLFTPEGYEIFIQDGLPALAPYFGFLEQVTSLTNFSWGVAGSGWGEGSWSGTIFPTSVTVSEQEIEGWGQGFWYDQGVSTLRVSGDMSIILGLIAPPNVHAVDAITKALFTGGYLGLKSAGVEIRYFALQSVIGRPVFGWGAGPPPATLDYFTWGKSGNGWGAGNWIGTAPPPPPDELTAPPVTMAGWGLGAWPLLYPGP